MQCEQKEQVQTARLLAYVASLSPLRLYERFMVDVEVEDRITTESAFELRQSNISSSCVAPFLSRPLAARALRSGLRYMGVLLRTKEYDEMPFGCYTGTTSTTSTASTTSTTSTASTTFKLCFL
jgi:hypothetical protein